MATSKVFMPSHCEIRKAAAMNAAASRTQITKGARLKDDFDGALNLAIRVLRRIDLPGPAHR